MPRISTPTPLKRVVGVPGAVLMGLGSILGSILGTGIFVTWAAHST